MLIAVNNEVACELASKMCMMPVDKLDELDTSGVEPMSHIFGDQNVFREDVVTNGDNRSEMLANAPKVKDGQYQVPKTIG